MIFNKNQHISKQLLIQSNTMKTKNLLMLLAMAGILIFASCKKESSSPDPLSKTEAEATFTQAESDFNAVTDGIDNIEALELQANFDNFFSAKKVAQLNNSIDKQVLDKAPYFFTKGKDFDDFPYIGVNINNLHGTYTYSTEWSLTSSEPTDKLVLIMPYGESGTATLTYSNYETKTIGDYSYTSRLKAELKLSTSSMPIMSWEYTQLRTTNGYNYKFVYTIGDYTKTSTYSHEGTGNVKPIIYTSKTSRSIEWRKNGEVIYAKSLDYSYTSDGQQGYTVSVDSKFRVKNIVIKWTIDFNDTTVSGNINDIIKITVWTVDGAKVGDIIFKLPETKVEYVPYIVFNDDTEVALNNYLTAFGEELYNFTMYLRYFDK